MSETTPAASDKKSKLGQIADKSVLKKQMAEESKAWKYLCAQTKNKPELVQRCWAVLRAQEIVDGDVIPTSARTIYTMKPAFQIQILMALNTGFTAVRLKGMTRSKKHCKRLVCWAVGGSKYFKTPFKKLSEVIEWLLPYYEQRGRVLHDFVIPRCGGEVGWQQVGHFKLVVVDGFVEGVTHVRANVTKQLGMKIPQFDGDGALSCLLQRNWSEGEASIKLPSGSLLQLAPMFATEAGLVGIAAKGAEKLDEIGVGPKKKRPKHAVAEDTESVDEDVSDADGEGSPGAAATPLAAAPRPRLCERMMANPFETPRADVARRGAQALGTPSPPSLFAPAGSAGSAAVQVLGGDGSESEEGDEAPANAEQASPPMPEEAEALFQLAPPAH